MTEPVNLPEPATVSTRETDAKSLLRGAGIVDPWFLARYGLNLYRGCEHGCAYCDGRAERYYVTGDFAREIVVKRNAVELLRRELARVKEPGYVLLGGGVCDSYQPAESQYRLARGALEVVSEHGFPVHVLTKSALVTRDLDLLADLGRRHGGIVSCSIQTLDDAVRARFEPGAAPIPERLRALRAAKDQGLATGVMAMPVLPGISDRPEQIDALVAAAADVGVDFVCFGALTLRPGAQKTTYLAVIAEHYPEHAAGYAKLYGAERRSGAPLDGYLTRVDDRFHAALERRHLPSRPPHHLFRGKLPLYSEIGILLEHREHAAHRRGARVSGLAAAGFALQTWARGLVAERGRRRGFSYTEVEAELRTRVADGTLSLIPGITPPALAAIWALCDEVHGQGPEPNGQREPRDPRSPISART